MVPMHPFAVKVDLWVPQMLVMSDMICGALGAMPLDICMLFELILVPHVLVQVAVYVPAPTWIGF
jgi:hypothetical protein